MYELRFTGEDSEPECITEFGRYYARFHNWVVISDIDSYHGEEKGFTTVYSSYLDDEILYRGFCSYAAFDAMEEDYALKMAGSLEKYMLGAIGF